MNVLERRRQLLATGYPVIPLYGKAPPNTKNNNNKRRSLTGWEQLGDITDEMLVMWSKTWPDSQNTGILTRAMPTLDLDILNEEAGGALEDHVREQYEERGLVLVRIGKPPKRAIPFRTIEPFDKFVVNLIAPNGSEEKIEFLADGAQVVAFGIHPETQQPYRWHGGMPGETRLEELPYIGGEAAHQLVDELVQILVEQFGYTRAKERPRKHRGKSNGQDAGEADRASAPADWQFLIDNILAGRALHNSLRDLAAKMVASGTNAGAAVNALRAMMNGSQAPRDERFKDRYDEIPRLVRSAQDLIEGGSAAAPAPAAPFDGPLSLTDFHAYMPMHQYIFANSRELWPVSSVNARLPPVEIGTDPGTGKPKTINASAWLDQNRPVEQMTWAPGEPMLIANRLISEGGWTQHTGCTVFNLYRAPTIAPGDPHDVAPWIEHLDRIYPDDREHIIRWLAHRVQWPGDKINHALVLGGPQGIGKDTLLEPVKHAVGPWNFREVSPQHLLGRFNGFVKSVILRVSEARDLGDVNRYAFYDHMKIYTAAPPDVLRCDEKNLREYSVPNVCGVVITSNHKTDGIYLPADDRRHFVAWCDLTKDDFEPDYWNALYGWYEWEGYRNVAAYLAQVDLDKFDPKAPAPHTAAFYAIVDANRAPEDAELADVLDRMGNPDATTLARITTQASGDFDTWIRDRKNRRAVPHRLEQCGYVPVRNDAAKDGLWKINQARQVVYARAELSIRDRIRAAQALA